MCLINLQYKKHPRYKIVIAANRDEFYGRPAKAADFWKDQPAILAGRDLSQMGTWLGVTKSGRFAALTNYRDPSIPEKGKISRGVLVADYLASDLPPEKFLQQLVPEDYTGFNLLIGDLDKLYYYNNLQKEIIEVTPGTHGLSNHFLNTPWPKVVKGQTLLKNYLNNKDQANPDDLFELLLDSEQAADPHLPVTGVGLEFERVLSPIFIKTENYGTRSATVLLVDYNNKFTFAERIYQNGEFASQQLFEFQAEY